MNAYNLLDLLLNKHHKDICVPECKTGPTMSGMNRFDLWVQRTSWAHGAAIGYEVKVARSDFLNDKKWIDYLSYCNEFYFVSPAELIKIEEVPAEAGLLWASKNGTMLYTKKKAPYRNIRIPEEIYQYILMARAKIRREGINTEDKAAYWKDWLETKEINYEIGHRVSKALREQIQNEINKERDRHDQLEDQQKDLVETKKILNEIGLSSWDVARSWNGREKLQARLDELAGGFPNGFNIRLQQTIEMLENLKREIARKP